MENHNFWNESYKKVPLYRLKSFYRDDVVFVLRHLQHHWIIQNIRVRGNFEGNHHFMRCLVEQLNQCAVAPMIRYWIESVCEELLMSPDKYVQQIVESFAAEQNSSTIQPLQFSEIDNKIRYLRVLKICHEKSFQQFEIQWKLYEYGCNTQSSEKIRGFQNNIVTSIKDVIQLMTDVLEKVIQSRNDCLSHQNSRNLSQLTEIQVWFDELTEILWSTRTLINGIQKYDETCCFAELNELHELFKTVIGSAIILESQPSEIISTEKNCPTSIRILLTLSKFIDVKDSQLDIHLFSEREIAEENALPNNNKLNIRSSKFQVEENSLTCHLKDLKVLKVEREQKKTNSVIAQKYILKYELKFEIDKMEFNASIKSWPFFVIVNRNQAPIAKAALLWDKHFPNVDRSNSKASVPWGSMEMLLKTIFNNETGCDLSDLNLKALHEKCSNGIIKNGQFVWSKSCAKMPMFTFTFWDWFDGATKLTKKCLSEAWKDGLIDGFSSDRLSAHQFRKRPVAGTFLLRFSDSALGALTPVYFAYNENLKLVVKKFAPFSIKEFEILNRGPNDPMYRGIGNLISDLNECTHLANGESKSEAFAKHFKDIYVSKEGYETRPVNTSGSSQIQTPPVQPQSAESDINNPIASNDVSSATFNTVSNDIPDTFVTPYHFTSPSFSPSISFQSTPSPSQLQCVQFQNSFTRSPDITSAPPNTVPNDNTYATGNSSNISTLPSPNFSPSIPFRPSPSPVQSQRFENILIGSSNFQSTTPNKVPNDLSASKLAQDETRSELNTPLPESYNDGMTGCSSILPTMEPTRLTNFNSFNVTQVEYSRSVCDPPVPQPDYHNYDNIDSNTIPIELDYVNNYDNGGDVSMANANANDLMF